MRKQDMTNWQSPCIKSLSSIQTLKWFKCLNSNIPANLLSLSSYIWHNKNKYTLKLQVEQSSKHSHLQFFTQVAHIHIERRSLQTSFSPFITVHFQKFSYITLHLLETACWLDLLNAPGPQNCLHRLNPLISSFCKLSSGSQKCMNSCTIQCTTIRHLLHLFWLQPYV